MLYVGAGPIALLNNFYKAHGMHQLFFLFQCDCEEKASKASKAAEYGAINSHQKAKDEG